MELAPFGMLGGWPSDFGHLERAIERVLDRSLAAPARGGSDMMLMPTFAGGARAGAHPMDIVETPTDFRITADAPGFTPGDVTVELSQGTLTISGKRQAETMDKTDDGKVVRRERHFSSFTRSFTLPENTKDDGVTATLADGVLTVSVPKTEPQPKPEPKRIAVTGGGGDAAKL